MGVSKGANTRNATVDTCLADDDDDDDDDHHHHHHHHHYNHHHHHRYRQAILTRLAEETWLT